MIELEIFKEPEQDFIEPIPNNLTFKIANAMWDLESYNPKTGEVIYEKHSGNIYCWVDNKWTQLWHVPKEENKIEPI